MHIHIVYKLESEDSLFSLSVSLLGVFTLDESGHDTDVIAGSLESANSSILPACNLFKDFGGEKNQDFMLIRLSYSSNMIGCGGDVHG